MVLAGLDLAVDEGELYGLIGPNGAGKTTALRVALGLLKADAGLVRLLGRDPRSAAGAPTAAGRQPDRGPGPVPAAQRPRVPGPDRPLGRRPRQ
jgi:ABC-type Fe3+/spermidine/putrescine transport system ATPase subunit